MTNEHTSLEKYTSHTLFSKGLRKSCERAVCERWVGDGTDRNLLTPNSSDYCSTSFLILLGCSTGGPECLGPLLGAGSHSFELQLKLKLTPAVAPGYIIVWHPPASRGRRNWTEFNLSRWRCTCFLIDGLVEGHYVTL